MKNWLIDFLCCPVCGGNLTVKSFEDSGNEILNGMLLCECQRWYPIIDGLPRILWGEHRGDYLEFISNYERDISKYSINLELTSKITTKKRVRDTFTTIWDRFPRFGIDDKDKEKFYDNWMSQKLGFDNVDDLYGFISSKKKILEVGVGSAQKLKMIGEHTSGKVVGLDISSSAEHAYKTTREMSNVTVIQADLFAPPLKRGMLDFIISDGVLHHTPDTKKMANFSTLISFVSLGS